MLICALCVVADTLRLKDGTVLEGKVIEQGDRYWIKLATGESKLIPKRDVQSFERGDARPGAANPPAVPGGKTGATPPAGAGSAKPQASGKAAPFASVGFATVKTKADRVEAPIQAIQLWDNYIASKPAAADLKNAQVELERWQKLAKDNAEKIKGVWVGGSERKRIVKKSKNLVKEGNKKIEEGQSEAGFKKFEEALGLYPQGFEANFYLGLYYLKKSTISAHSRVDLANLDKAIKTLENAARIAPKSSSVWTNLAIGYSFKNKHKEAVQTAYKAATMHESPETVGNLVASFRAAPVGLQQQAWCKTIMESAILMAERHSVPLQGGEGGWRYVPPVETDEIPGAAGPAGAKWSGSGFFITSDGYLLTNHHVITGDTESEAKPDIAFRIRMDDGTEMNAELVALDDAADIALMKVKTDSPVVPLKISSYLPNQGASALVLGYPATGDDEHTMQISPGTVKSIHEGDEYEVWFDLNTTHGNSGGPIVDASNNVIAILTAGRQSFNMTIVLGVGPTQIKTFLDKIGDKAPKLEYAAAPTTQPSFDSEALTKQARASTVLIHAIRAAE
jgi:S1-C subfamily serine protease